MRLPIIRGTGLRQIICASLACASLVGCSDVIPGLNVRMDGSGSNVYKIVSDDDGKGYKIRAASSQGISYQIIPVDAGVLFNIKRQSAENTLYPLPSILPSDVPPEYIIGPGDVIFAQVWDHPELTTSTPVPINDLNTPSLEGRLVSATGEIFYPYVGVVKAAGKTSAELRDFLTRRLTALIRDPQVDVRVVAFRASRVEITGEVLKPGTITLDDTPKGILQAIDLAGGLTPAASRLRVTLVRKEKLYSIDLGGLLSGDRLVSNTAIQPGDVIHVPDQSGDQVFMLGAVAKQSPVVMTQSSMTLIQALATSGGLDSLKGNQSGVFIFHMHQGASGIEASVYAIDMSRPDGILIASEFPMSPRDVVFVEATKFSQYNSIVTQLLPTVTTIFELHQLTIPN